MIRMEIGDMRVIGRNSAGVRLFNVADEEHVVSCALIEESDEDDADVDGLDGAAATAQTADTNVATPSTDRTENEPDAPDAPEDETPDGE
jgi:DNA gyrase subunit A